MKSLPAILISTLLIFGIVHSQNLNHEGAEEESARQQWFKELNRAEPGVNYKAIQSEVFRAKAVMNNELIKKMKIEGKLHDKFLGETVIADGKLTGEWKERGSGNQAGRIHCVDVDFENGNIYAASSGGNIWRGGLEGGNWVSLNDIMQFPNIISLKVYKVGNNTRVFVFDENGAYFTDDMGLTWQKPNIDINEGINYIISGTRRNGGNNSLYFLGESGANVIKVMESNDNGMNFHKVAEYKVNNLIADIAAANSSETDVFYLVGGTLYSISNNHHIITYGSISDYSSQEANVTKINLSVSEDAVAAGISTGAVTNFYRCETPDYNLIKTSTNKSEELFRSHSLCVSEKNNNSIIFGGVEGYYSSDRGGNFTKINKWDDYNKFPQNKLHADIPAIQSFVDESGTEWIYYCTDGGIFLAKNNPLDIQNISMKGLDVSQYYSTYTATATDNYDLIFAGSQDQGFQRTTKDSGNVLDFEQVLSGDFGHLTSIDNGTNLWFMYPYQIWFGKNISSSESLFSFDLGVTFHNRAWIPPVAVFPDNPQKAIIAWSQPGGFKLTKATFTGSKIDTTALPFDFDKIDSKSYISSISFSPFSPNKIYALSSHGILFGNNNQGDGDWNYISGDIGYESSDYLNGAVLIPSSADGNLIYAAGSGYSNPPVYVSANGGVNFSPMNTGLPKCTVFKMAEAYGGKILFAATSAGPYVYFKSYNKWFDMSGLNAPQQIYWSVEWLPNTSTVRFGTYGRGIWDFKINSINDVTDKFVPVPEHKFKIQAFPNPTSDNLKLKFSSDNPRLINSIRIYDIDGRVVGSAGENLSIQNGSEISLDKFMKSGIPSGNYMAVATSDGEVEYALFRVEK